MDSFGQMLRRHREQRGLSLRDLELLVNFRFSHISQVERGVRRPTEQFARRCDQALDAGGVLVDAYQTGRAGDTDMRRRTVIQAMGAVAAAPAVDRLAGWESIRHCLADAVDPGRDEWAHIIAGYGVAYYRQSHDRVMAQLGADLTLVGRQLAAERGGRRPHLLAAAAQLSVLAALGLSASGQTVAGRRWWADARRMADASGCPDTRVLVRAWDVVNGCYDGRNPDAVVGLSDEALPLTGGRVSAAVCGLLAGRAQALSLAGRHGEAVATVRALSDRMDRVPASVVGDEESLWGWPEHRLRHTESWVYTHAGRLNEAGAAQDRALGLYPASQQRLRTQVGLHRAAGLVRGGHILDGLRMAADLLDRLPRVQHTDSVRVVAGHVAAAVPESERRRPAYGELVGRVTVGV